MSAPCTRRGVVAPRRHQVSRHANVLPAREVTWEVRWTWDVYSLLSSIDKTEEHLEGAADEPPGTQTSATRPCVAHVDGHTAGMCAVPREHARWNITPCSALGRFFFKVLFQNNWEYGATLLRPPPPHQPRRKSIIGDEPVTRWK